MRVDPQDTKAQVIPRNLFDEDMKRGFAICEHIPAKTITTANPRNLNHKITTAVPATNVFHCMLCAFTAVDSDYAAVAAPDGSTRKRTGIDLIKEHIAAGNHFWPYDAFSNPYGNVADVTIEGIEDYPSFVKTL